MQSDNNPFNNLKQNEIGLFSYIKISNSEESFKNELKNNQYKNMKDLNKTEEDGSEEEEETAEEEDGSEEEEAAEEEECSIWIKNYEIRDLVKCPDELNKLNNVLHHTESGEQLSHENQHSGGGPKVNKKKQKNKTKKKQNK
jgi:hypothetical protein